MIIKKVISHKYLFYFGTIVYTTVFLALSVIYLIVFETRQVIPILLCSIFFMLTAILILFYFSKQIYIRILNDNSVHYGSLFMQQMVSLQSIGEIKQFWFNMYKVRINGKLYVFQAFKPDVEYLKEVVQNVKETQC